MRRRPWYSFALDSERMVQRAMRDLIEYPRRDRASIGENVVEDQGTSR